MNLLISVLLSFAYALSIAFLPQPGGPINTKIRLFLDAINFENSPTFFLLIRRASIDSGSYLSWRGFSMTLIAELGKLFFSELISPNYLFREEFWVGSEVPRGPSRIGSLAPEGRYKQTSSESEDSSYSTGFFFPAFHLGRGFLRWALFLPFLAGCLFFLAYSFLLSDLLLIFNN